MERSYWGQRLLDYEETIHVNSIWKRISLYPVRSTLFHMHWLKCVELP